MSASRISVVATLAALALSGCASTRSPVRVHEDGDAFFPRLRIQAHDLNEDRKVEGRTTSVEIGLDYVGDRHTDTLAAGDEVQLDDVLFTGPGDVRYDYDLYITTFGVRFGAHRGRVRAEGLLGAGWTQFRIDGAFGGATDGKTISGFGLHLGLVLGYELLPSLEVVTRATATPQLSDEAHRIGLESYEVGLEWEAIDHIVLGGGYRWLDYGADYGSSAESDLELDLSGPWVGIELDLGR